MDKTTLGLVGALSALATLNGAQAAALHAPVPRAQSFAELLDPIPNAAARLALMGDAPATEPSDTPYTGPINRNGRPMAAPPVTDEPAAGKPDASADSPDAGDAPPEGGEASNAGASRGSTEDSSAPDTGADDSASGDDAAKPEASGSTPDEPGAAPILRNRY